MKRLLSTLVSFSLLASSWAQNDKHCGTTEATEAFLQKNPDLAVKIKELEKNRTVPVQAFNRTAGTVYIIPVVFHILHNYGQENISDAQVIDAVNILNRDFRKLNADTSQIVPEFRNLAADCEIEFRLARKDPYGNCTNGIDRIATPRTENANDDSKLNQWAPESYLNIWVVSSMEQSGVAGYSYFPSTAHFASQIDGIVMLYDYVGSIGSSNSYTSRTLTHEVGHYLDLPHTWGNTNAPGVSCGDDGVGDTPQTKGFQYCMLNNSAICNSPVKENVQNYMEYSFCTRMFTYGQKSRMQAALNSLIASRNNLWSSANLIATGTDGTPQAACAPKADFNTGGFSCQGGNVSLYNRSWRASATSYKWILPGADSAIAYAKNPVVRYYTPGTYDVTLISYNAAGSDTLTKKDYVHVIASPATAYAPFNESFEDTLFRAKGWIIYEDPTDNVEWKKTSAAGYLSSSSMMLDVYNSTRTGNIHSLITPAFDLTSSMAPALEFKTAYATKDVTATDVLNIYYSNNCATTWTLMGSLTSNDLTAGIMFASYTPYITDWKYKSFYLPSGAISQRTIFRFEYTVGQKGNNFYLDDINIFSTVTSVTRTERHLGFSVFPNPSAQSSTISFTLEAAQGVSLKVCDVLGREISALVNARTLPAGEYRYETPRLSQGVYFVKLSAGNDIITRKLIIE